MHIEILEFYLIEHNEVKGILRGTLRVKLPDLGIHILGICVNKQKDRWYFSLPGRQAKHHETGQMVRYPFIAFEDKDKQRELIESIREQAPEFIEKRMTDTEKQLIFPERQKKEEKKPLLQKAKNSVKETKITGTPRISNKVWQDPPKRIQKRPRCKIY